MDPPQDPEERERMQRQFEEHASTFNVHLKFPANVTSSDANKPLRTSTDLIQIRLLEAGISYEEPQPVAYAAERLSRFVNKMQQTGCFETVKVEIDQATDQLLESPDSTGPHQSLNVLLKEKNWYRLYVGGGLRNDMQGESGQGGNLLAKTQFETTGGLTNITGHLDTTALQYTVDATSNSRWDFQHVRPLDSIAPELLQYYMDAGNYSLGIYAALDSLDYEWTRSYKERQRKLSMRISNHGQIRNPEMAPETYVGLEWSWLFRDILPRRHSSLPYALDASPEIAKQSGPSEKNSISLEYRTNGEYCDSKFNPTQGLDHYSMIELAGPPGDVGFIKAQGGVSAHLPILPRFLSLHGSIQAGLLHSLTFGGACQPATVSDRFHVGGPLQLRGFTPAGIGPRTKTGSDTAPQGDSLGGEFFYTATVAASMTTQSLDKYGIRFMAFGNLGSLTGSPLASRMSGAAAPSWMAVAKSTRASAGLGVTAGLPMGRVEATYAWPLRYGPRDVRRNVQFGLGFSFG